MMDDPGSINSSTRPEGGNRIGDTLQRLKLITPAQAEEIAEHANLNGLRFGEAAIELGLLSRADLHKVLAELFSAPAVMQDLAIDPALVMASDAQSVAAENFRTVRNALALRWFKHDEGAKVLAVISPARGDGRSTVAANLAISFAQVGFRTLLIDADMRYPSQHALFKLDDRYGLSGYLAERPNGAAFHEIPGLPSLTVMPVGGIPPNPQELLLRPLLTQLLEILEQQFDVILIDTPAAETGNECQLVAATAGGALIVTRREKTKTRSVVKLAQACREFGTRIAGSIMVDW